MNLEEAQARLKKTEITAEQLDAIAPIYCLLDFSKDDFCKLVDAIGIDKWVDKQTYFQELSSAWDSQLAKKRYLAAKQRLSDLEAERYDLEGIVDSYDPYAL